MRFSVLIAAGHYTDCAAESVRSLTDCGIPVALVLARDPSERERELWRECGVRFLYSLPQSGNGATLNGVISSFVEASPDSDVLVFIGQERVYSAADAEGIAREACRTGLLTAGVRYGKGAPGHAGLTDRVSAILFRLASGVSLPDVRSGLLAIPAELLPVLLQAKLPLRNFSTAVYLHFSGDKTKLAVYPMQSSGKSAVRQSFFSRAGVLLRSLWFLYLHSTGLKFITSSFIAFLLDYTITLILVNGFHWTAEVVFVCAWIVSSLTNFTLNYLFAFRSRKRFGVAFGEYYLLAITVFAVKRMVFQEVLYRVCHVPLALASPASELLMYPVTYMVQKTVVFRKRPKSGDR